MENSKKKLKSFADLKVLRNNDIGEQYGKLIRHIKRLPTVITFERGKLTRFKFHAQKDSDFVPFIDEDYNVMIHRDWKIDGLSKSEIWGLPYVEYTVEEFMKKFGRKKNR